MFGTGSLQKMQQTYWKKSAKTWMCACCEKESKTQLISFHGSMVERPHTFRGGACSIPGIIIIFKLGLSPSQDENAKTFGGKCHSFRFYLFLVSLQWCSYEYIRHTLFLGFVLWTFLEVDWKLVLQWSWDVVIVLRLMSVDEMCPSPTGTRTHVSHIRWKCGRLKLGGAFRYQYL